MSDWGMRWPAKTKAKALADRKYLVGFEATGKHLKTDDRLGEVGFAWAASRDEAWGLSNFVAALRIGKTPREAFEAAWTADGELITPSSRDTK